MKRHEAWPRAHISVHFGQGKFVTEAKRACVEAEMLKETKETEGENRSR